MNLDMITRDAKTQRNKSYLEPQWLLGFVEPAK
jgi:hypothetical protein